MAKQKVKRIQRDRRLTPAEIADLRKVRASIERDLPNIRARALVRLLLKSAGDTAPLLKQARQRVGLTVSELGRMTGIQKSALTRLENDPESNPTVRTLMRYAQALGKRVELRLVDDLPGVKR